MSSNKNCLNCGRYTKCSYVNKRADYRCDKWKAMSNHGLSDLLFDGETESGIIFPTNSGRIETVDITHDEKKLDSSFNEMDRVLDSFLDNDLPVPKDVKVDDSDFPVAKNFWDFAMNKDWGFKEIRPFARQFWIATKVFGEYCPDCTKKKSGKVMKDIRNIAIKASPDKFLEKVVLLEHGTCPVCRKTKLELYKKKKVKHYSELAMCAGQRSGKSILTSFLFAYVTHRYLKLQKPAQLMTGVANAQLQATFVAIDKHGAMKNLWEPLNAAMEDSIWFSKYHDFLKDTNKRYGEELYKHEATFIHYRHRKMFLHPAVPNQRALRGATRFAYGLDEIGWFDNFNTEKVTMSADGVYRALNKSLLTARNSSYSLLKSGYSNIPSAYAFNISSPSSVDDKIMQLVTKHRHSKTILTVHQPTWEINPKVPRNDPEIISAYEDNPIAAECDYGANPPLNAAPFFENEHVIESAFTTTKNKVTYSYITKASDKEDGKIYKSAKLQINAPSTVNAGVMGIDAGYSNNSFSLVVGHREDKNIVYDVMVDIIPEKGKNVINYAKTFKNVVEPIIRAFNVKVVLADRWNSLFLLHKLNEDFANLLAEQYSVKYDDFLLFKSYLEGGRIKFPMIDSKERELYRDGYAKDGKQYPNCFDYMPTSHLYHQLVTVQDGKRTVEKAPKKTDDIFRALVLANTYLLDEDIILKYLKEKKINQNRGIIALGTESNYSGSVLANNRGKGIIAKL